MAPRTRSNRGQPFANLTVSSHEEPYNTKGLVGLPDELFLEIASHIPSMPLPTRYPLKGEPELEGYQARHMTFASLTQTCRSLRRVFLKHLWQRVEVVDGMQTPTGPLPVSAVRSKLRPKNVKSRLFSRELVRQLEIVTIREPRLAQHVREMNIVLVLDDESAKWDTVLQELAKRAAGFTNLRTVQLVFNNRVPSFQVRKLLKKYKYPQVTTLSISYPFNNTYRDAEKMRHLLASCPGLRHLAPAMDALCLNSVFDSPNLEVVGPLFFRKRYAQKLLNSKNLRDISIHSDNFIDRTWNIEYLAPLRELKYLHTIRIGVHEEISTRFLEDYSDKLQRWVEYCRWLLSGRPNPGNGEVQVKKQVLVMFYSESGKRRVETHDVDACR